MPIRIERDDVLRLMSEEHAQLVEVLSQEEYQAVHLAGAINLPLKALDPATATILDGRRPVIVYCHDFL